MARYVIPPYVYIPNDRSVTPHDVVATARATRQLNNKQAWRYISVIAAACVPNRMQGQFKLAVWRERCRPLQAKETTIMTERPRLVSLHQTNRHPVDRMGELKAEIDRLKAEYKLLRQAVIDGESSLRGEAFHVIVTKHERRNIPLRDAEKHLSKDIFEALVRTSIQVNVTVRANGSNDDDDDGDQSDD